LQIDAQGFPIVRLHYDREELPEEGNSLVVFDALLDREQPFVLIGHGDRFHMESAEDRKHIAIWMKRNGDRLNRLVKAMVYVQPDTAKRLAARPAAFVFEKFWGFPMLVTGSDREAAVIAEQLLAVCDSD
jgi:hypothetical protein